MVNAESTMALKINFASLSMSASVDQQTGSLSVFDILEELRTPQVPIQLQSLVLSLAIEKLEEREFDGKILIHLLTPDGKQQMIGNGNMQIPADQKRMKAVFRFGGFPVVQFGMHRFVLSCLNQGGAKIAESILSFEVTEVTPAPAQGEPNAPKNPMTH